MGRPNSSKLNREEKLKKKRLDERKRYQRIKNDPILYAQYKERNKAKYKKRVEEKKTLPINEMTPRQRRIQRKKWRVSFKKYYDRKKEERIKLKAFLDSNSPPTSDSENSVQNLNLLRIERDPTTPKRSFLSSTGEAVASTSREKSPTFVASPSTSRTSTPYSSGGISPEIRLRKLRYRKDKHIEFLKSQLESVRSMNDIYKKQIDQLEYLKDQPNSNLKILKREPNLSEGLVKSFKDLKTHAAKKSMSEALKKHIKLPLKAERTIGPLRVIFRNRSLKINTIKKNKEEVKIFLEDDENSSIAAGRKEYVKKMGVKYQKRYLNDSLYNLFKKFLKFNATRISYPTFCRFRPFWILPASKKRTNSCLCILHENFQLLITALHKNKVIKPSDYTGILREICCDIYSPDCLFRTCKECKEQRNSYMEFDNSIEFFFWAWKSDVENVTQKSYRVTKKIKIYTTPEEAIAIFEKLLVNFLNHCGNIRTQRQAIANMKANLEPSEAIIHIDFAENYKCQYAREIQAAHFGGNKQQVSLHTSVLYYFDTNRIKMTKCYATASSNTRHDAAAVWAHLNPLLEFIERNAPNTTTLYIISDSAGSQYRNMKMYFIITALNWLFPNIQQIIWNFTEAGHGKGAPDGVGAVLKRCAANFVKCGNDVQDFDTFIKLLKEKVKNIIVGTVSEYDIFEKDLLLPTNLRPFKGTQKVHQIVWNMSKKSMVALRTLSCTESTCRKLANCCPHGKHLSFHEPTQPLCSQPSVSKNTFISPVTSSRAPPKLKILSDILIKYDNNTSVSNPPITFVALPIRSPAFSALSELDLPQELQRSSLDQVEDGYYEDKENVPEYITYDSDGSDSLDMSEI